MGFPPGPGAAAIVWSLYEGSLGIWSEYREAMVANAVSYTNGGAIKSVGHSHMECGGKRSATPLWLVFVPYPSQDEPLKPKRRRASLAAALHKAVADPSRLSGYFVL